MKKFSFPRTAFLPATRATTALALLAIASVPISAHEGAMGVVKERMELMKSTGKAAKELKFLLSDHGDDFDRAAVIARGKELQAHAGKIPALFPEGSKSKVSEAKAEIWTDWTGFRKAAGEMDTAAENLAAAAEKSSKAETYTAFIKLVQSCRGCHDDYRQNKN